MKKRLAALFLALTLLLALTACGGNPKSAASQDQDTATFAPAVPAEGDNGMSWLEEKGYAETPLAPEPSPAGDTGNSVYGNSDAKLIRRAQLTVQSTQFDEAVLALQDIVSACGGYFESSDLYSGGYRDSNALRSGSYTVRVPAEQYDTFLSQSGDVGYVVNRSESSEDVGERYYDMESRLKTQKVKQERLMELLTKAESMEDIIQLENALSDVEYQIESYTSDLNRYDALIGYATITVELNEVRRTQDEPGAANSLGQRMGAGLSASLRGFADGFLDLLVWVSYNLVGILLVVAVVGAAGFFVGRKLKKRAARKAAKSLPVQEKEPAARS